MTRTRGRGAALVRLLQMTELLRQRRWTQHELAEEFDVCHRTIARDLRILQRAGIDIAATAHAAGDNTRRRQFSVEHDDFGSVGQL